LPGQVLFEGGLKGGNIPCLIPFHAFLELADFLIFVGFSEDVKMFVGDQEEIVFITSPFLPRTFHFPLHFYDVFA
jgi:hypothetical protein